MSAQSFALSGTTITTIYNGVQKQYTAGVAENGVINNLPGKVTASLLINNSDMYTLDTTVDTITVNGVNVSSQRMTDILSNIQNNVFVSLRRANQLIEAANTGSGGSGGSGSVASKVATSYADAQSKATGSSPLDIITPDGTRYSYNGATPGVITPVNTPIAAAGLANSSAVFGTNGYGALTVTKNSGSFGAGFLATELEYAVFKPTGDWIIIGLLANGAAVMLNLFGSSGVGGLCNINNAGTLSSIVSSGLPTTPLPAGTRYGKIQYSADGSLTVSYKTYPTDAYTVFGTVSAASLAGLGYTIAQQKMGGWSNQTTTTLTEVKIKGTGEIVLFPNARTDFASGQSDIQSRLWPWYNAMLCAYGDSITFGWITANPNVPSYQYDNKLYSKLKLRGVINKGHPAYAIGVPTDGSPTANTLGGSASVSDLLTAKAEVYLLLVGVNDFKSSVVLGDASTPTTIAAAAQTTTVGGLNYILTQLKTAQPEAFILVCTSFPTVGQNTANLNSLIMRDYVEAIKKVCDYLSVPYLDFFNRSNISINVTGTSALYFQDGLHPLDAGYEKVTDMQAKNMAQLKY